MDTAKLVAVKAVSAGDGAVAFHEADLPQPYRSAPELLEALRAAETWLSGWASAEPYLTRIRAAIASATGEG